MPDRDESLERLAKAAATDDRLRIGVRLSVDDGDGFPVDRWLRLFGDANGLMPSVGLAAGGRRREMAWWR